jgi:hypothetical protein
LLCLVLHGHVKLPLYDLGLFELQLSLPLCLDSDHLDVLESLGSVFGCGDTFLGCLELLKSHSLLKFFLFHFLGEGSHFGGVLIVNQSLLAGGALKRS